MKVISVVHNADILVDTYQFHDSLKKEVVRLLSAGAPCISQNDSNVKVDRSSQAYSVEVRSPFLDYRIIEFARSIPQKYRYSSRRRKKILRDILKKYIPEKLFHAPKKGFSVPIKEWSRDILKNVITKKLNKKNLRMIPGIKVDQFNRLMKKHFEGKIDFSLSIWRVYILILWFEKNITNK